MGKLAKIKELIQEAKELSREFQTELNEAIEGYNLKVDELAILKEDIAVTTLTQAKEVLGKIQNLPQSVTEPLIDVEDAEPLKALPLEEPLKIEEPKTGTFAAKFWGFIVFVLFFGAFGAVGAYMKHLNFANLDINSILEAFGFYSDLLTQSQGAAPVLGIVAAAVISFVVAFIVYKILINKAASVNLEKAEEILESVKSYVEDKKLLLEQVKSQKAFLEEFIITLKGAKIFDDEFVARTKRILFFEGEDYNIFSENSKKEVMILNELTNRLAVTVEQPLYIENGLLLRDVEEKISEFTNYVEKIKKVVYG